MENELPGLFASGGVLGILTLVVGGAVLGIGIVVAMRRGSRGAALAVLAAALLPLLLGRIGTAAGNMEAQCEIAKLGPAVTPKDLAAGQHAMQASTIFGALGGILAVCGGVTALARSRA